MVDAAPGTWAEVMEVGGAMVDGGDATYALALTGTTYDAFPLQTAHGGYVFGVNDAGYDPSDVGITTLVWLLLVTLLQTTLLLVTSATAPTGTPLTFSLKRAKCHS